ncbi:hypothetical protein [Nocardia sp. XZ_19_369]|uniref:hypothetical protein n=1 Tax=Nocardia sp. XZ_19_369 TaxID=2769487 RepID=UPI00188E5827|nr:hypothetical protein [Nocardia sp. XZ_19_369]
MAGTVIAAALTAIANLSILVLNMRSTRRNEQRKTRADFETYRFKELSELIKSLDRSDLMQIVFEKVQPAIRDHDEAVLAEFLAHLNSAYHETFKVIDAHEHLLSEPTVHEIRQMNDRIVREISKIQSAMAVTAFLEMPKEQQDTVWGIMQSAGHLIIEFITKVPILIRFELRAIHDFLRS